jgi:hypothetical protein
MGTWRLREQLCAETTLKLSFRDRPIREAIAKCEKRLDLRFADAGAIGGISAVGRAASARLPNREPR